VSMQMKKVVTSEYPFKCLRKKDLRGPRHLLHLEEFGWDLPAGVCAFDFCEPAGWRTRLRAVVTTTEDPEVPCAEYEVSYAPSSDTGAVHKTSADGRHEQIAALFLSEEELVDLIERDLDTKFTGADDGRSVKMGTPSLGVAGDAAGTSSGAVKMGAPSLGTAGDATRAPDGAVKMGASSLGAAGDATGSYGGSVKMGASHFDVAGDAAGAVPVKNSPACFAVPVGVSSKVKVFTVPTSTSSAPRMDVATPARAAAYATPMLPTVPYQEVRPMIPLPVRSYAPPSQAPWPQALRPPRAERDAAPRDAQGMHQVGRARAAVAVSRAVPAVGARIHTVPVWPGRHGLLPSGPQYSA